MKKRLMSLSVALCLVFAMSIESFAATSAGITYDQLNPKISTRTVGVLDLEDLQRLMDVSVNGQGGAHPGDGAKIINAKRLSNTEWVIRVNSAQKESSYVGDYYVTCLPYTWNDDLKEVVGAPNKTKDTPAYGPSWFYCGLFNKDPRFFITNEKGVNVVNFITGFAVARRITRWPDWTNLNYTTDQQAMDAARRAGTAQPPIFNGFYNEPSSDAFMESHTTKPIA